MTFTKPNFNTVHINWLSFIIQDFTNFESLSDFLFISLKFNVCFKKSKNKVQGSNFIPTENRYKVLLITYSSYPWEELRIDFKETSANYFYSLWKKRSVRNFFCL